MLLSICIPTHHGRGWCLRLAVEDILAQIAAGHLEEWVEVCVSDNASADETQELMTELLAKYPSNVRYSRMPINAGLYNHLNAVRLARGKYCWLFGSDDMIAEEGVQAMVDLLNRYPDCSGVTCNYLCYDYTMETSFSGCPATIAPWPFDQERQFSRFNDALVQLGPSQTFMSVQVFRHDLWDKAIADLSEEFVYTAPHHVHTYLISRIMLDDPRWVWSPARLVKRREDNRQWSTLKEGSSFNHPLIVLRELTSIWTRATGQDRATFRAVLAREYRVDFGPKVVRHTKMLPHHTSRDDCQMLVQFTRYLAALPEFWWGSFLCLLIPHWVWKVSNSTGILPLLKKKILGR